MGGQALVLRMMQRDGALVGSDSGLLDLVQFLLRRHRLRLRDDHLERLPLLLEILLGIEVAVEIDVVSVRLADWPRIVRVTIELVNNWSVNVLGRFVDVGWHLGIDGMHPAHEVSQLLSLLERHSASGIIAPHPLDVPCLVDLSDLHRRVLQLDPVQLLRQRTRVLADLGNQQMIVSMVIVPKLLTMHFLYTGCFHFLLTVGSYFICLILQKIIIILIYLYSCGI